MSRPGRFTSREIAPVPTEWEAVRASDPIGRFRTENLSSTGTRNPNHPARLSYPDSFSDNI